MGHSEYLRLLAFANNLVSIKDETDIEIAFLRNLTSNAQERLNGHFTRYIVWRRFVVAQSLETLSFMTGLVATLTLKPKKLGQLLIDEPEIAEGTHIMSTEHCVVPAFSSGVVRCVKPVPFAVWQDLMVPTCVQVSVNGKSEIFTREDEAPHKCPIYRHGTRVLIPLYSLSSGLSYFTRINEWIIERRGAVAAYFFCPTGCEA